MAKITRKEFLKSGAIGAGVVAATSAGGTIAVASEEGGGVAVHAHARVEFVGTPPAGVPKALDVSIDAAGQRRQTTPFEPLSGIGWDSGNFDSPDQAGSCIYTQRGKLEGDEIHLHGRVIFSTPDSSFAGAEVVTIANLGTGHLSWTFAGLPFHCNVAVVTKID